MRPARHTPEMDSRGSTATGGLLAAATNGTQDDGTGDHTPERTGVTPITTTTTVAGRCMRDTGIEKIMAAIMTATTGVHDNLSVAQEGKARMMINPGLIFYAMLVGRREVCT
jgi:hypothetical protein